MQRVVFVLVALSAGGCSRSAERTHVEPAVQSASRGAPTPAEVDAFCRALLAAFSVADRQALGNLIDARSTYAELTGTPVPPSSPDEERRIDEMLSSLLLPPNERWSARLLSAESAGDAWRVRLGLIDPHGRANQAELQVRRTGDGVRAVDVWTLASGGRFSDLLRSAIALDDEVRRSIATLEASRSQGRCDEVVRTVDGLPARVRDNLLVYREKLHCAGALPARDQIAIVDTYLQKFPDAGDADYQRLTLALLRNDQAGGARALRTLHQKHGPDGYLMAYAALMHLAAGEREEMERALQVSLAEEPDLLPSRKFALVIAGAEGDDAQIDAALREIGRLGGGPADLQSALYEGIRATAAYERWAEAAAARPPP